MLIASENSSPTLHIVLPNNPDKDRSIEVIFPEHVTVRRNKGDDVEHLYMFRTGQQGTAPTWRRNENSLEYQEDFGAVHMIARATLEEDGVLFHYEFVNHSKTDFDMIYAVTDPRLTGVFHDVRLERTYVHHKEGFDLLSSEVPERLKMPLSRWLPARYLASYTWPVPVKRVEKRPDGITYYNKSRAVDEPLIATVSQDGRWVVASFSRTAGNVWSNPELTCQHVDPQVLLAAGANVVMELKILILKGSLNDILQRVRDQRKLLK